MNRRVLPTFAASLAIIRARSSVAFQLIWTVLGAFGLPPSLPYPPLFRGDIAGHRRQIPRVLSERRV